MITVKVELTYEFGLWLPDPPKFEVRCSVFGGGKVEHNAHSLKAETIQDVMVLRFDSLPDEVADYIVSIQDESVSDEEALKKASSMDYCSAFEAFLKHNAYAFFKPYCSDAAVDSFFIKTIEVLEVEGI